MTTDLVLELAALLPLLLEFAALTSAFVHIVIKYLTLQSELLHTCTMNK